MGAVAVDEENFRTMQKLRAPIYRNIRNEGYSLYPRVGKYSRVPLEVNGSVENVDKNKKIQIQHFLPKAHDALDAANTDIERGYIEGAANRAYYTVFYLATACLFVLDVVRAKHLVVKSAFGEFFVKEGRVEPEYAEIFNRALDLRLEADYSTEYKKLNRASAKQIVADAEKFVKRMEQYLREVGALD